MSDAVGRRYNTNVLTGTRVGKFGRKATKGLGTKVPKPHHLRAQDLRRYKDRWAKADEDGKLQIEQEVLALACIQVDLELDKDGRRRQADCCHHFSELRAATDDLIHASQGKIARGVMSWADSLPPLTQGYTLNEGTVPQEDHNQLHSEIAKNASDFNFSCRDYARERDLVQEIRAKIEAEAAGETPDYSVEPKRLHEAMKGRHAGTDGEDNDFVPATACLNIPKRKRRHRVKTTGVRAGLQVLRSHPNLESFTFLSRNGDLALKTSNPSGIG